MLDVQNLRVEFPVLGGGTTAAIADFSLRLAPGEIFGVVGEGGAGKTVLARSLLCLPPEPGRIAAGSLRFGGEDLLAMSETRLETVRGRAMSLIAANPRGVLNPLKTVGEQISRMARVHLGLKPGAARAATLDMLRAVQIPDPERRFDAYPHELSGGMAQRIVIAIALVCAPRFIIADDATSGLDVTVQAQVLDLLRRLAHERGSSLLFITRDMGITAHYCDRVAVMYRGEVMEMAPREDFFLRPRHPYTILLMAAFSHNRRLRAAWSAPSPVAAQAVPGRGCSYAARCPRAGAVCLTERPPLAASAGDHAVRCHNPVAR
ncbi:ABC transporter ATP-binding protein [Pseudoxanthobacter sp.]|uniref:ABC transporter ATP-binding protein n=1 Tax=Pseudoxanthobacter sp. TaxID=1925742 RepID=UPI002FE11A79